MNIWVLLVLCVVQGLTEFLPVSSSGHLLFFEQVLGVSENLMFINLFLHIATLLAVVIVFRKIIWDILKRPFQPYVFKLIFATLFSIILAFVYKFLDVENIQERIYPFGFLATSILLLLCHWFQKKSTLVSLGEISTKQAVLVGVVQGVAVVPGLSRSGSTISSLILSGQDEKKASEFSFLLSIPIIVGGFVLELLEIDKTNVILQEISVISYIFAFLVCFAVSLIALKLTIKFLKNKKFIVFSVYTFLMFIVTFVWNYFI